MAEVKVVKKRIKVVINGGTATPAPPLGPALGQAGIPIQSFVQLFNDRTSEFKGMPLPTQIIVYEDKTFDLIVKKPSVRFLIMDEMKLPKGSAQPHIDKVGVIKKSQLLKIYERKKDDLSANDAEAGCKIIAGTCRAMGVTVDWAN